MFSHLTYPCFTSTLTFMIRSRWAHSTASTSPAIAKDERNVFQLRGPASVGQSLRGRHATVHRFHAEGPGRGKEGLLGRRIPAGEADVRQADQRKAVGDRFHGLDDNWREHDSQRYGPARRERGDQRSPLHGVAFKLPHAAKAAGARSSNRFWASAFRHESSSRARRQATAAPTSSSSRPRCRSASA